MNIDNEGDKAGPRQGQPRPMPKADPQKVESSFELAGLFTA